MSAVIGALCKAYYDADGDIASPTWVEIPQIQGASKTSQKDQAEIKERGLLETTVMTAHKSRELTIQLTRRPSESVYQALQAAYEDDTKIGLALATGAIATIGTFSWQGEVYITGWDDPQGHTDSEITVTFRPAADYDTAPDLVETTA